MISTPKHTPVLRGWRKHPPSRRWLHPSRTTTLQRRFSSHTGYVKLKSDPLRILFCGSDYFSVASLRALHALHQSNPDLIESIDVLVRPGKRVGRGLKAIKNSPCYQYANELELPIHQRDTFTGWDLPFCGHVRNPWTGEKTCFPHPTKPDLRSRSPQSFNMIIAVSFGLFVPPRIINSVKYGGLNLHPSLLPDLPGPAPIPWTILARRPVTGVTLQTLHPAHYDRGVILAQTPAPGIPVPDDATAGSLLSMLSVEGASLLTGALTKELHVPPYRDHEAWWRPSSASLFSPISTTTPASSSSSSSSSACSSSSSSSPSAPSSTTTACTETATVGLRDAPKLDSHHAHIDWRCRFWGADKTLYPAGRLTASDISRAHRSISWGKQEEGRKDGGIRTAALLSPKVGKQLVKKVPVSPFKQQTKRIILNDVEPVYCPQVLRDVVVAIVQARRSVLLMSALAEEQENELEDEEEDNGDHDRSGPSSSPLLSPEDALTKALQIWSDPCTDVSTIGSIAWTMPDDPNSNATQESVRLPVMVDQESETVIIPIGLPYVVVNGEISATWNGEQPLDALRIKLAKVEGEDTKRASRALRQFLDPLGAAEVQQNEFAVDVMAHRRN